MSVKSLTMVARYGESDKNVIAYLLVSNDYKAKVIKSGELARMISGNPDVFTNLELDAKGAIKSSNGDMDNYVLVHPNTNQFLSKPRNVILSRIENNGKLVGYTIYTSEFAVVEVGVKQAAELAKSKLIANGKIRHTESGDIVSSIKGNFPLVNIRVEEAAKKDTGKIEVEVMLVGYAVLSDGGKIKKLSRYFCGTIKCESVARMTALYKVFAKNCTGVIDSVKEYGGKMAEESLSLKRLPDGSVYGAYSLSMLENLKKSGASISLGIKERKNLALFSLIKYDKDGNTYENTIVVNGETMSKNKVKNEAGEDMFELIEQNINAVKTILK